MTVGPATRRLTVNLPAARADELARRASAHGISAAYFARRLIELALEHVENPTAPTAADPGESGHGSAPDGLDA